jgi:hypothetical protein
MLGEWRGVHQPKKCTKGKVGARGRGWDVWEERFGWGRGEAGLKKVWLPPELGERVEMGVGPRIWFARYQV